MARNLYADIGMFEALILNNETLDAADAASVERIMETASRRFDNDTRHHYYAKTETPAPFDGNGLSYIRIPDLLAATTIKLDEDGDRTFELTLNANTDYYLKRHGAENEDAPPFTMLELDGVNGSRSTFLRRKRLVEIAGRWGYTEDTEDTGDTVQSNPLSAIATTLTVSDGTKFAVGQTLKIETEQLYVSAIASNNLTVARGVNGTTAASHAQNTAISRYIYVPGARQAVLILTARIWKRRDTAYANVIANETVGRFEVFKVQDPDYQREVEALIRGDSLVGGVA